MVKPRSVFKNTLRRAQFKYNCHQTFKLKMLKYKNANDYWRLLKGTFCGKTPFIKLSDFTKYFRAVNNPDDLFFIADDDVTDLFERYIQGEVQVMFEELNIPISLEEVKLAIGQLSNRKSGGPDKLLNDFFIHGKEFYFQHYTYHSMQYLKVLFSKWLDARRNYTTS